MRIHIGVRQSDYHVVIYFSPRQSNINKAEKKIIKLHLTVSLTILISVQQGIKKSYGSWNLFSKTDSLHIFLAQAEADSQPQ